MARKRGNKLHLAEHPYALDELLKGCLLTPIDEQTWSQFFDNYFNVIERTVKKTFLLKIRSGHEQLLHLTEQEIDALVQMVFKRLIEYDRQALRDFRNHYKHSVYAYLKIISINVVMDFIDERTAQKCPPLFFSLDELANNDEKKETLYRVALVQNQSDVEVKTPLITESMLDLALQ